MPLLASRWAVSTARATRRACNFGGLRRPQLTVVSARSTAGPSDWRSSWIDRPSRKSNTVILADSQWIAELHAREPVFAISAPKARHFMVLTGDDVVDVLSSDDPEIARISLS
jgi:hypothetical protein